MEMFVLSMLMCYAFTPDSVNSAKWLRNYLRDQSVPLRYCFPNLCKRNYLFGNLPFYKIQVNRFMAWDELSGAKIITKCNLWMRGMVPF